jgi:hypothetical protein
MYGLKNSTYLVAVDVIGTSSRNFGRLLLLFEEDF